MVVVYIREAHASDTWPMRVQGERPCPQSTQERIQYAKDFAAEMALPDSFCLRVDGMGNAFNTAFGSWPTCYYVVCDKKLRYVGECPEDSACESYNVAELFAFLNM